MKKLLVAPLILFLLGTTPAPVPHSPADIVLRNAKIYTMDAVRSWANALAIKNGRIVYVGDESSMHEWTGDKTQVMDLGGRMVMPSFIDAHVHPISAGVEMNRCVLDNAKTKEEALSLVKKYAEEHQNAPWILGNGWQLPLFPQANPLKEWLDAIVPDRPVFLSAADGHSAWVNSKALQLAGIKKDTPDPQNGRIERNSAGEPTGTLRESATDLVSKYIPPVTEQERMSGFQAALKVMNGFGITGFQDASVSIPDKSGKDAGTVSIYQQADHKGALTARVTAAFYADPEGNTEQVLRQIQGFEKIRNEYKGKNFYPTAVKIFEDGVIESETAALLEPYLGHGNHRGDVNWSAEKLNPFVDALYARRFQIHIHAIGDRAIREALTAIELAENKQGMRDARSVIAHLELINPQDIPRFQKLHVIPCFQPIWAYADPYIKDLTLPKLGSQRSRWIYPMESVIRTGATMALGSDWNVSSVNPLDGIEVAVTRQDPDGPEDADSPFIPEEQIDLPTALAAYTIGSAYSNFWEKETGSLEVGKSADLIVLSQNLFDVPPPKINQTKVLLTLLQGKAIFRSGL